jgi:hypothetical protein
MLGALNQDCKSYIKRIFETFLRYVLPYAAALKDQDAMKLSEAISDARQTMPRCISLHSNYSTLSQRHERKCATAEAAVVLLLKLLHQGDHRKRCNEVAI